MLQGQREGTCTQRLQALLKAPGPSCSAQFILAQKPKPRENPEVLHPSYQDCTQAASDSRAEARLQKAAPSSPHRAQLCRCTPAFKSACTASQCQGSC